MYYQPDIETMSREDLEALQLERLQALVKRVYQKIPFYKESFDKAGINPEDIKSLADLTKLPFTVKQDMRDAYPFGLFAVPRKDVVRVHCSSGTTGTATVVGYTQKDLENWGDCFARALYGAGCDLILLCKLLMAMACLLAVLAPTMEESEQAALFFLCLLATPNAKFGS